METHFFSWCVPSESSTHIEIRVSYLHRKGTYLHSKGSYLHSKGSYLHSKGCYLHSKGSYLHSKGSYLHSKGSYPQSLLLLVGDRLSLAVWPDSTLRPIGTMSTMEALRTQLDSLRWELEELKVQNKHLREQNPERAASLETALECERFRQEKGLLVAENGQLRKEYDQLVADRQERQLEVERL